MRMIPVIEISRHSPGMITALGVSVGLTANAIMKKGTIAQKEKYVPELLTSGPQALSGAKALIRAVAGRTPADVAELTAETIAHHRVSAEGQEGMRAFLQKKKPSWSEHS